MIKGNVYGVLFAVDVYYHKRCYSSFTYTYQPTLEDVNTKHIEDPLIDCFFRKIELKVLRDKEAYLLTNLLQDIKEMSVEYGLTEPPRRLIHTYQLKKMIQLRLGNDICISSFRNRNAVHSINVDPLLYSYATIKGHGLREDDIVKAFANLVRRKLDNPNQMKWPPKAKNFIECVENSKPLTCIYNAIIWSTNPRKTKNINGYSDANNHEQAEKIAAITQSWESLISKKRSPAATALSLTLHRITGSKKATTLLHRCGIGTSYTDVRFLQIHGLKMFQ